MRRIITALDSGQAYWDLRNGLLIVAGLVEKFLATSDQMIRSFDWYAMSSEILHQPR